MKIKELVNVLENIAPKNLAMPDDVIGLLLGDEENEIQKILVCMDITSETIDYAIKKNVNFIVSHHPFIFYPIKNLNFKNYESRNIANLIKNNISVYSMHTNLDCANGGINDCLAKIIDLSNIEYLTPLEGVPALGRIGCIDSMQPIQFIELIREKVNPNLRHNNFFKKDIQKVCVCGGAGMSLFDNVIMTKTDAFVTSDVKHHQFIMAKEHEILLIDAGHFETEIFGVKTLCKKISKVFKDTVFYE